MRALCCATSMWPARTSRNPPPQLATLAGGYGQPVVLDRASPRSLSAYPLIITRRDRREHRRAPARLGGGQLAGSSLVPDTIDAGSARIAAGRHRLVLTRGGFSLAPGSAGSAVLNAAFLTPAGFAVRTLREVLVADWRALCGRA